MRAAVLGMWMLGAACGGGGDLLPPLGEACPAGSCADGLACVEATCTTSCTASSDCRVGTECRTAGGGGHCVAIAWPSGAGQYPTGCVIGGDADCATDFVCLEDQPDDPNAYCAGRCDDDRACPPSLRCGDAGDGSLRCLRRDACAPCERDEQCVTTLVADGVCAEDTAGGRACSKACDPAGDGCPTGFSCTGAGAAAHCVHVSGTCLGGGATCTFCDGDVDCGAVAGSSCKVFASGEHFCSPPCPCDAPYNCIAGSCWPPPEWDSCQMP